MSAITAAKKINHHAYKDAYFMTGNVETPFQISSMVNTIDANFHKNHAGRDQEAYVDFTINRWKKKLTTYEYDLIKRNALNGIQQTIYLITHKGVDQGLFICLNNGFVLSSRTIINRQKNHELMDAVQDLISSKMHMCHLSSNAIRVANGREAIF